MARAISGKKPKNFGFTMGTLLSYMGRHKFLFLAVAVLVTISALANLLGTYMIRPVVNSVGEGDVGALIRGVAVTAGIYGVGVLAAFGYTQTMVRAAQKVLYDIRRDLFAHIQKLPLRFFDTRRHGDIMSYFTNDVDTVADALNNSFAMTIQSFIQMTGTLVLLFVLNWQLSLVVVLGYAAMFAYIRFSAKRSTAFYTSQQAALGDFANKFGLIAMHSKIAAEYKKMGLIDYNRFTITNVLQREVELPTLNGLIVLENDRGTFDNTNYNCFLFGAGAFLTAEPRVITPDFTDYDPETDGGTDKLYTNRSMILHPNGVSFKPDAIAKQTPTDTELATATNWDLRYNAKNVRIAKLVIPASQLDAGDRSRITIPVNSTTTVEGTVQTETAGA